MKGYSQFLCSHSLTLPSPCSFLAAGLWQTSQRAVTAPPAPGLSHLSGGSSIQFYICCMPVHHHPTAASPSQPTAAPCLRSWAVNRTAAQPPPWQGEDLLRTGQCCTDTTSSPRHIRVTGEVPADTKEQQCAGSMTLLSPGERLALVVRRVLGFICTFSQGRGEKLGAGGQ